MSEWSLGEPVSEHEDAAWRVVRESLRNLQFGTVTLVVQDGLIIQVDRTDKKRLRRVRANGKE